MSQENLNADYQKLKYCIFGAGALGGCLGAFLADEGVEKDVTFIARGDTLKAIQLRGIEMHVPHCQYTVTNVKAVAEEDYHETPDVVIIATKVYNIEEIIPFLDRVCGPETIVLPLQNAVNMGQRIKDMMSVEAKFASGVAYVPVVQIGRGVIKQKLPFYRVVFGPLDGEITKKVWKVRQDMIDAGMAAEVEKDPVTASLRKYVRVATISGVCVYYDDTVGVIRENPEALELFKDLCNEIIEITEARGEPFYDDALDDAMTGAFTVMPDYQTSIKFDMDNGNWMEVDTMFFDVYELGKELGLELPAFEKVCMKCGYEDYAKHRDRKKAAAEALEHIRAYEAKYQPELHQN